MKNLFKDSLRIIRESFTAYLLINVIFYGLIVAGFIYALLYPDAQINAYYNIKEIVTTGSLSKVYDAYYLHRNLPYAVFLTFTINLFLGTFVQITVPSLIIPFAGFFTFLIRAFSWGVLIVPDKISLTRLVLFFLEGQGYVLGAFAVYVFSVRFLNPSKFKLGSYKNGYWAGLKCMGKLYVLIACVLLISAFYEVAISSPLPFPRFSYSSRQLGFSGTSVQTNYHGQYVFYDSMDVKKGDAKVAGYCLENIEYFKPGDMNAARITKTDSLYAIQLYLDKKYWNRKAVNERFKAVDSALNITCSGKYFMIQTFCFDSSGQRQERYY